METYSSILEQEALSNSIIKNSYLVLSIWNSQVSVRPALKVQNFVINTYKNVPLFDGVIVQKVKANIV